MICIDSERRKTCFWCPGGNICHAMIYERRPLTPEEVCEEWFQVKKENHWIKESYEKKVKEGRK